MAKLLPLVIALIVAATAWTAEEPPASSPVKRKSGPPVAADATARVKLPRWWTAEDHLPQVKSNCVRCHLTAGRELTAPVQDFARSVHDLHGLTCSDCHGGDREKDAEAHEEKAGFIGTKLSAHLKNCAECHSEQAEQVHSGPHYWDHSKKINLDYPVCIDCHGHHDVEKPPVEFALATVCRECHLRLEQQFPQAASLVSENDKLWNSLRQVRDRNAKAKEPVPEQFQKEVAAARALTANLIHPAKKLTESEVRALNAKTTKLRGELDAWLKQHAK